MADHSTTGATRAEQALRAAIERYLADGGSIARATALLAEAASRIAVPAAAGAGGTTRHVVEALQPTPPANLPSSAL